MSNEVGINGLPVTIFAPESVTLDNLRGLFAGTYSNPMIFYISPHDLSYDENVSVYDTWRRFIIYELGLGDKLQTQSHWQILNDALPEYLSIHSVTRHHIYSNTSYHRGLYGIIYPRDEDRFSLLYDFPTYEDYYFYAHPNLKHTVFLGTMTNYMFWEPDVPVYFGFPEGWIEYMASETRYEVIVTPESDQDNPNAPRIYLSPLDWINQPENTYPDMSDAVNEILQLYTFDDDVSSQLVSEAETYIYRIREYGCIPKSPVGLFEKDGRKGYVSFNSYYRLEASVPIEMFEEFKDILQWSAESLREPSDFPEYCP